MNDLGLDLGLYGLAIITLMLVNTLLVGVGYLICAASRKHSMLNSTDSTDSTDPSPDLPEADLLDVSVKALQEVVMRLERRLENFQQQPVLSERHQASRRAFEVAGRLSLQGADRAELVKLCGLTEGEAELIQMLHVGKTAENAEQNSDPSFSLTLSQQLNSLKTTNGALEQHQV